MKAGNWIDRVRSKKGLPSDYAAAKVLGLSRFTVSGYRQRPDATLDEDIAVKVANVLEMSPAIILADQAMERAKSDDAKSAWSSIIDRLGGVAAMVVVSVASLGMSPAPSYAAAGGPGSSMCIMLSYEWVLRNL